MLNSVDLVAKIRAQCPLFDSVSVSDTGGMVIECGDMSWLIASITSSTVAYYRVETYDRATLDGTVYCDTQAELIEHIAEVIYSYIFD